jgi:putative ABC transport system permease protein
MALGPHWLRERRFWKRPAAREIEDELSFHLAMRAELLEEAGLDASTARDLALERFGDLSDVRNRCLTISHERERRMKRLEILSALGQQLRHAGRRLRAAPGFATAVLLMLALGIGATTTVFSVVDGILLRPLPFDEPERLVDLSHTIAIAGRSTVDQSDGTFLLYRQHATRSFESMAAWRTSGANLGPSADAGASPERVAAAGVTAGFFPTLRVVPVLGRAFGPDDDRPGAPPVMILSASLWKRKFGGNPAIVGQHIVVDGRPREVIGVMPDRFHYPETSTAVWLPLGLDRAHASPASFNYKTIARLRTGVSPAAAATELGLYLPHLLEEFPVDIPPEMFAQAHLAPVVKPLRDVIVGDVARLLWILLGAVVLLLSIACANVASLFMVRAEGAQRDLAIRMALGAGRATIIAQYLSEAALLGVAGGGIGVLLALLGVRALHLSPAGADLPRLTDVSVDSRVLLFALAVALLSAGAVSLLPVLRARRVAPALVLKESSRSATIGRDRQRARSTLVVAQVALALVLVAGSTLMARSFARLRDVEPGFVPEGLLTVRVALPRSSYGDASARLRFLDRVLAEVQALPGVRRAAVLDWVPLSDDSNDSVVQLEDHPLPSGTVPPDLPLTTVSPGYFATMGIPLVAGRDFAPPDIAKPSTEVVVSRALAERFWPAGDAVGKRMRPGLSGPWFTIVGIVGNVHMQSLEQPAEQLAYFPLVMLDERGPTVPSGVALAIRTTGDPAAITPALRGIFKAIDPGLPTYDERSMAERVAAAAARTRFVMVMLGVASLVALSIGMVGLYGVLAYGVTLRRREIGVRMALGATARDVTRMIARRGIALAALGVGTGLLGALAATRVMHGLLYGVSPTDPIALAGTCVVLLAVASFASWLPARRAASMNPMEALRRE